MVYSPDRYMSDAAFSAALSKLGREGWEIFLCSESGTGDHARFRTVYLRREAPSTDAPYR